MMLQMLKSFHVGQIQMIFLPEHPQKTKREYLLWYVKFDKSRDNLLEPMNFLDKCYGKVYLQVQVKQ